ncbi:UDP-N-acetylmuramoylalanine--D-glutamate ligase [Vitis vinifera]|uniref:UDP-N-acetylmuramoylalanine--D-glutamate ligase n=1 Tax=Vitis vinifera TaxID=29760 RepID=A0A438EGV3_VITVI|nr:UDP-N-acetylmuramoylalanine--D-glutamate ligase [Vitis vinifera]
MERKIHLINWEVVCTQKEKGGLGIQKIDLLNKALLGKWIWRFAFEKDIIWKKMIGVKYGQEGFGWRTNEACGAFGVGVWKEILKEANWCWDNIIFKGGNATVNEVWDSSLGQGGWNLRFARDSNDWELDLIGALFNMLRNFKISQEEDSVVWKGGGQGTFGVRHAYNLLVAPNTLAFPRKMQITFFYTVVLWEIVLALFRVHWVFPETVKEALRYLLGEPWDSTLGGCYPMFDVSFSKTCISANFQVAVVEVSSYQLEVPNKHFCPSVAVVLNLTSDHLERHKTMKNYAITKCRLLSHMTNSKLGILPFGNKLLNEAMEELVNEVNLAWIGAFPGVKVDKEEKVASLRVPAIGVVSELKLGALNVMGTHNYYNAAVAALSVLGLDMGIDTEAISSTIEKLRVPPHRMQIVHKDSYGVTWIDDSKATNVEATYTGLLGLKEQKSVILLGGLAKTLEGDVGSSFQLLMWRDGCLSMKHHKGRECFCFLSGKCQVSNSQESNGFEQLVEPLKYHRCVITFGFSGPLIQKTLSDDGLSIPCFEAANLEDAVNCARSVARYGDAVVLSPGCASFDEFRNFEHRGKVFQELVFSSE